ncbi:MAG: HypC/HybG/HupF family hydrogenase formation chaperone [Proteobacteria bacterium]|nr:HypC/HybG/HupF family hydrogenase formation chaperone [Pseudomonadota bacterium]
MCLAVPMKVIEIEGPMAQVEESGVRRSARVDLVEGIKVGDYVIVHAGIAIDRLEPEEAAETLKLFAELFPAEMGVVEADGAAGGAEKS